MTQQMLCRSCRYDLRETTSGRCPECGMVFDSQDPRTFLQPSRSRAIRLTVAALVVLIILFGGLVWLTRPLTPAQQAARNQSLYSAAKAGNVPAVKSALQLGAQREYAPLSNGIKALITASNRGHVDVVQALLQAGADPNQISSDGNNAPPLMYAVTNARDRGLPVVRVLLDAGAEPNARHGGWGYTALMRAVRHQSPKTVALLLDRGADPTLQSMTGDTALSWAIEEENQTMIELIERAMETRQDAAEVVE